MDANQNRGRSSFQGNNNPHISPQPSPHQYHDAVSGLGLDPAVNPQTFTSGKFTNPQQFSTPFLESTHPQTTQSTRADTTFYPNNQFNQSSMQDPQWQQQTLDPSYTHNQYMFQNNAMQNSFQNEYSFDDSFMPRQQANVNPADLSSPHGPTSPDLLSPESNPSPQQPPSPASTHSQAQYYTPQHSRHQSLDPASAAFPGGEWQGMQFQGHRRVPSDQSDISSNSASPYLGQQEVFDSIEPGHSPLLQPQPDVSQTYGIDAFNIADQAQHSSPGHSPYVSPRLLPSQQGLGLSQDVMGGQNHMGQQMMGPGPEIYTTQHEDQFPEMPGMHGRNESIVSDHMGRADQFETPSINIEPAPVSRQQSFEAQETRNRSLSDALSPPTKSRGRSKSDPHVNRSGPPSRSASPAGRSPSPFEEQSVRSLSPGLSASRDSSPGAGKNRRSSTSSIPTRDYILDLADPSRPGSGPQSTSNRVQKHPATFQCSLCPKRFTRAYNLRSHLRTHTDERPFVCTVCGKAFARQHDRKRHEGLHSGEKKFVCKGELSHGGAWGCGRRFARADALGRHFRSEAGRVCIKPLLDEEAAERERQRMMEQAQYSVGQLQPVQQMQTFGMDPSGGGGFALPAALLAQYPALNNIDWSTMPQGEDPGELSDYGPRRSFEGSSGGEYFDDEGYNDPTYGSGNNMPMNSEQQQQQVQYM